MSLSRLSDNKQQWAFLTACWLRNVKISKCRETENSQKPKITIVITSHSTVWHFSFSVVDRHWRGSRNTPLRRRQPRARRWAGKMRLRSIQCRLCRWVQFVIQQLIWVNEIFNLTFYRRRSQSTSRQSPSSLTRGSLRRQCKPSKSSVSRAGTASGYNSCSKTKHPTLIIG